MFSRVGVFTSLIFCVVFWPSLFVFVRFAIVLSVPLQFTDSDYPHWYLQTCLGFCVVFCRSLFVLLSFFVSSLYYLFLLVLRVLITHIDIFKLFLVFLCSFSFIVVCPFVLFHLAIVLSVLQFTVLLTHLISSNVSA